MKFTIFKWWESWIKPFIYVLILIATAGLIACYCFIKDDGGMIAFAVSISYALVLFLVMIPINKMDGYTLEKLYERETFYLSLKRLRDVTNNTIQSVDANDLEALKKHIFDFQIFTGREANMVEERLKGKKVPVCVKEKGFTYSLKMQKLEEEFLNLYDSEGKKKELSKCAKKLCGCYNKSCKHLENNYNRIARIYGGALFDLIERDYAASDTEYSLSYIGSKVDDMLSDIGSIRNELDEMRSDIKGNQRELFSDHKELADRLSDIEYTLLDIKDEKL